MGTAWRQLKVILGRIGFSAEFLLPTLVMSLITAVRTRVGTQSHPAQPHIREGMYVEVGRGISPSLQQVLKVLLVKKEYIAFAPNKTETGQMIDIMSIKFPLLKFPFLEAPLWCGLYSNSCEGLLLALWSGVSNQLSGHITRGTIPFLVILIVLPLLDAFNSVTMEKVTDYTRYLEERQNFLERNTLHPYGGRAVVFLEESLNIVNSPVPKSSGWEPSYGRTAGSDYFNSIHYGYQDREQFNLPHISARGVI